MKMLISNTAPARGFPSWVTYANVEDARRALGSLSLDALVIHHSDDAPVTIAQFVRDAHKEAPNATIIYPSDTPSPLVRIAVSTCGGIVTNGSYMDTEDALNGFLEAITLFGNESPADGAISVLNAATDIAPHLSRVAQTLISEYKKLDDMQTVDGTAALDAVLELAAGYARFSKENAVLRQSAKRTKTGRAADSSVSVKVFPRVEYSGAKTLYRVKVLGSMKYLKSFMMGFQNYLESAEHVRCRLIFVMPPGITYKALYKNYAWVTPETEVAAPELAARVVFTQHPTSNVINDMLLASTAFDAAIIVDYTTHANWHVVEHVGPHRRKVLYAVESEGTANRLAKLDKSRTFTSVGAAPTLLLSVPALVEYPANEQLRRVAYAKWTDLYRLIDAASLHHQKD